MFTAGTLHKAHIFRTKQEPDDLVQLFLRHIAGASWEVDAWSFFSNHYHLIARCPLDGKTVSSFFRDFHSESSSQINHSQRQPGRQVWHQYWDTQLTHERSVLARSAYVWHNPARHKLVPEAESYRWCSAGWDEQKHGRYSASTLRSFQPSAIRTLDDFEPILLTD